MNKYSKIKVINNSSKSRSMDFSDPTKPIEILTPRIIPSIQKPQSIKKSAYSDSPQHHDNDDDDDYEQKQSVASSGTPRSRFKLEKQSSSRGAAAVKRVFSMRRSSSVSERYCRIHDQSVSLAAPLDDDDDYYVVEEGEGGGVRSTRSMNRDKKQRFSRGSVLKACKRFFGL